MPCLLNAGAMMSNWLMGPIQQRLKRLAPALCVLFCSSALAQPEMPHAHASFPEAQAVAGEVAPEQILVVGRKPGPGLWKVSKGEHVLWVFGTYAPLPLKMEWRSHEVEAAIAQSQGYLLAPSVTAHVGLFRQLTLLPFAIGFKNNPDGATLRDVLPADVYARWQVLKQQYIGDDDGIERERPLFAADALYRKGLAQAGLGSDRDVRRVIENLVKQHKLATISPQIKLAVDEPVKLIKQFKKSPLEDVACFSKTMERLERDITQLRVRANAWAKGDLGAIAHFDFAEREEACTAAMTDSAFVRNAPQFQTVKADMRAAWLAAADKALTDHRSTFAVLPLKDILGNKSLMAALEARGYAIRHPE